MTPELNWTRKQNQTSYKMERGLDCTETTELNWTEAPNTQTSYKMKRGLEWTDVALQMDRFGIHISKMDQARHIYFQSQPGLRPPPKTLHEHDPQWIHRKWEHKFRWYFNPVGQQCSFPRVPWPYRSEAFSRKYQIHIPHSESTRDTGVCKKNAHRPGFKNQKTSSKRSQNVLKVRSSTIPKVSWGPKKCFRYFRRN